MYHCNPLSETETDEDRDRERKRERERERRRCAKLGKEVCEATMRHVKLETFYGTPTFYCSTKPRRKGDRWLDPDICCD